MIGYMASPVNITLRLSLRERQLIQQYGYPFEKLAQALEKAAGNKGVAVSRCPQFEAEQLMGDLAISIKIVQSTID